ncbi:MAG TPA: Xaa-Pro peptidase family protein [Actinomycetota bacterium]|nr:Xaa-Pro peptidase family protein [Actinomycetota bacterium]
MDHALRRGRLAEWLQQAGIEALLVNRLPNVRYLTGFTGSNGQVIVRADGRDLFLTDGRYEEQARHEVPDLERRGYRESMVRAVRDIVPALGLGRLGFEVDGLTYHAYTELGADLPAELVGVNGAVERLRRVKDADELRILDRAQEVTDAAFEALLPKLREGVSERELAFELEIELRTAGADDLSFETIAAFGEDAAEPHHDPGGRPLRRGDVVKLDFGALVDGYHCDMTRTVAFGHPPRELHEIHDLVRRAQRAGIEAVRAGVDAAGVDAAARSVIEEAGMGERFAHGLGHGVGLEIHEDPFLHRSSQEVLPAGAVVTIEPGVYVPGLGGVRIEDMVEVREDGRRALPRSSKELIVT